MVDPISVIRQMMAESKYFEAQKVAELHLSIPDGPQRPILLPLYLEILQLQDKRLPEELIIDAAEIIIENDVASCQSLLQKLPTKTLSQNYRRIQILKIKIAQKKGQLEELYALISEFNMYLFENRVPARTDFIDLWIAQYFKNDFHLKLQALALDLMLGDLKRAEVQVSELIGSCVEKASPKGTKGKLLAIGAILGIQKEKKHLEIYQNYSLIAAEGIKDKYDYKKIAEMIIYFDDFRFQVLILDLLCKLGLSDASTEYALEVRANSGYDFVYLDKYFGHLKKFFAPARTTATSNSSVLPAQDYKLEGPLEILESDQIEKEPVDEEESLIVSTIKFHSFTPSQLIDLSVSFLQSRFYRASSEAAGLAMEIASTNVEYLKACYLKATSLYQLADFRSVLDFSHEALTRAESQDDILSFLYLQSEAYAQMGLIKEARRQLKKILSIDEKYRLTRERLERLDEI